MYRVWPRNLPTIILLTCSTTIANGNESLGPGTIEEILITAERREANVQDTAIAVTALSRAFMDDTGIVGAIDLAAFSPGMSATQSNIVIRGVGRVTEELGADPGVPVYLDGIYTPFPANTWLPPNLVARTEVLRGPQGILYGRNALGGAVNMITQGPTREFEGELRVQAGNLDLRAANLGISGPISDSLSYRLFYSQIRDDGLIENSAGSDLLQTDSSHAEFQLTWKPDEHLEIWLKHFSAGVDARAGPVGLPIDDPPRDVPTFNSVAQTEWFDYEGPNPTIRDPHRVAFNDPGRLRLKSHGISAVRLTWQLDAAELFYLGSYQKWTVAEDGEFDGTANPAIRTVRSTLDKPRFRSHELRLASSSSAKQRWLIGAYYFDERRDQTFSISVPDNPRVARPAQIDPVSLAITYTDNPEHFVYRQRGIIDSTAYALFGQIERDLTERWHGSLGLRYNYDEKTGLETNAATVDDFLGFPICDYGDGPFTSTCAFGFDNGWVRQSDEWRAITGRVALEFRPRAGQMFYGSISTGHKSGGFKLGNLLSVLGCNPAGCPEEDRVDEEEVLAYELGYKTSLLEDRLQLNLAAYYYDYEDFQVPLSVRTNAGFFHSEFINAGSSRSAGFEAEAVWQPVQPLMLLLAYAYQRTKILDMERVVRDETDFRCVPDLAAPACAQTQPDGNELPNAPRHKATLNGRYHWQTAIGEVMLGLTYSYTSKQHYSLFNDADRENDAYYRVDLHVSWESPNEKFRVIAWAKNLLDEDILLNINRQGAEFGNYRSAPQVAPPRTYALEAHYRF